MNMCKSSLPFWLYSRLKDTYMLVKFMTLFTYLVLSVAFVSSANAGKYISHGPDVDMNEAVSKLKRRAMAGDAMAQLDLGRHYNYGEGVSQDNKLAYQWISNAANQGLHAAKVNLAEFYIKGTVVDKDLRIAEALLNQAAKHGSIEAHLFLFRLYRSNSEVKDYEAAIFWLKKAAEEGSVKAMEMMAAMFLDGRVVEPDYTKSAYWLNRGAEAGDLDASYNLADFYMQGTGVTKDTVKGTKLLKNAALKGHTYSIDYFVEQARKNSNEAQQLLKQIFDGKLHDTEAFRVYRQEVY